MELVGIYRGFDVVPAVLSGFWESVLPFLAAVLLHELGHLAGSVPAGVPLRRAGAGLLGLRLEFALEQASYRQELAVLLSGSLFGLSTLLWIRNPAYRLWALVLNLANLLPVRGLDGGGILCCLLHRWMDGDRADRVSRAVFLVCGVLVWAAGMWIVLRVGPSPMWMLCGTVMAAGEIRNMK